MKLSPKIAGLIGIVTGHIMAAFELFGLSWFMILFAYTIALATAEVITLILTRKPEGKKAPEEKGEVQRQCSQCKGKGTIQVGKQSNQRIMTTCPICEGIGWRKAA